MTKKYFFFDIDGTLGLGISSIIPADSLYCLRRLMKAGHFVSIASGRLQHDAQSFADRYGIPAVVADGGNSLSLNGDVFEMTGLPLENCKSLLHELDRRGFTWAVVTDNTIHRYTPYETFPHADPRNYMKTVVKPIDIDELTTIKSCTPGRRKKTMNPIHTVCRTWNISTIRTSSNRRISAAASCACCPASAESQRTPSYSGTDSTTSPCSKSPSSPSPWAMPGRPSKSEPTISRTTTTRAAF